MICRWMIILPHAAYEWVFAHAMTVKALTVLISPMMVIELATWEWECQ